MKQSGLDDFFQKRPATPVRDQDEPKKLKTSMEIELDGQVVELSPEQAQVVEHAISGKHVFFTGAGGVGKSLTLKAVIQKLREKYGKQCVFVTASTGIAACNIDGTTLHSFAGVGLGEGTLDQLVKKVQSRADSKLRWARARALIVDEISMIDPGFFEILEALARRVRPPSYRGRLFGGLQIILAGDFLQLPYVRKSDHDETVFLFETKLWSSLFKTGIQIHLTRIYRQNDRDFIALLQAVRMGNPSEEHLVVLRNRIGAFVDCRDGIRPTRLYPHRVDVKTENVIELHQLGGELKTFVATDKGSAKHLISLDKHCQAPKELQLKVDAQVVLLRNLDFPRRLVNGSRGVVTKFTSSLEDPRRTVPVVKFACGVTQQIEQAEWKMESGSEVVCSRKQIPLALCWASSIHKAMGMTLDKVETRLASVFEYGQAYTALSRVTSLEGLCLLDFDERKIMAHPRVVEFYKNLL